MIKSSKLNHYYDYFSNIFINDIVSFWLQILPILHSCLC